MPMNTTPRILLVIANPLIGADAGRAWRLPPRSV